MAHNHTGNHDSHVEKKNITLRQSQKPTAHSPDHLLGGNDIQRVPHKRGLLSGNDFPIQHIVRVHAHALSHKPLQAHHISHELRNPRHIPCLFVHIQRRIHQEPAATVFHSIYTDFHTRRKTSRRHKRAANRERRTAKRRRKPHKAPRARQTTGKRTAETGTNKKSRRKADNKNARHDGRPKQRKTLYRRERIHNPKEHSALRHKQGIPRTQCLGSRNMPTHTARQKIIGDMRHAQQKSGQHNKPAYSHTRQTEFETQGKPE